MPPLDWYRFARLPGGQPQNFEHLCRALVRLHFGSRGQFRALRNQPGVEFHLKLLRDCPNLGNLSRWYGWQCKFHKLTSAGHLRAASKTDIENSLRKTEKQLPHITDWVLWTPYTLSKRDQDWFNDLKTNFELHLWSKEEIDAYLNGPGIHLRNTYFGELIATPEELKKRHCEAVQPICKRWLKEAHQTTEAEREIRRMLGEPGSWDHLIDVGKRLQKAMETICEFSNAMDKFPRELVSKFIESCSAFADMLLQFHAVLIDGDLEIIQQELSNRHSLINDEVKSTPRRLRKIQAPIALDATNALHDMQVAQKLLKKAEELLGVGLVAVLADAGGGKTQLAAELTSPQEKRPAGVLLHGFNLHKGQNLNDLARSYTLYGKSVEGFEQLLVALDSAAKRACCRLPLIIDGLNEAENPKDWKAPLASLSETVKAYSNILVVCTLRTEGRFRDKTIRQEERQRTDARESFAVMALPPEVKKIESKGFGRDTKEAIEKYFYHFKIETGDVEIPVEFLEHPLNLRIFCQVTNPDRQSTVNIGYFPALLVPLFEQYIENSARRIAGLTNLSHSYTSAEVHKAIYNLGTMLWVEQSRKVSEEDFRRTVGDTGRQWDSNIVNLLMQEGLVFRNRSDTPHEYVVTPVYDALGGFMIANSLLSKHAQDNSFEWLNEPETINLFGIEGNHELAADIFRALVSLVPRRMPGAQLWKVVPFMYRNEALELSALIEADSLDMETVEALRQLFNKDPKEGSWFYQCLYATRAVVNHPLSADFLNDILCSIVNVAERDMSWAEWIRQTRSERFSDITALEKRWKSSLIGRSDADQLRAKWLMWHLTSTDRELRDVATRALYWFGRGDPSALFNETISSLTISDPYVPERMFAASYGVAMALHGGFEDVSFSLEVLLEFAQSVFDAMFVDGAPHRTTHLLLREYASRIIELAVLHSPSFFPPKELARTKPPFSAEGLLPWGETSDIEDKAKIKPALSPLQMDFKNYTLGELVPGRRNYDDKHEGYKKIKARILWKIEQLGWSGEEFEEIDRRIAQNQRVSRTDNNLKKTDRYGKKYSWVAYFEMSGLLHDQGEVGLAYDFERTSDVDVDPSFPEQVLKAKIIDVDILGSPEMKTDDWIRKGEEPDITPYLKIPRIEAHEGPWVALDGYVIQEDEARARRSFCFVRSFIVKNTVANEFFKHLSEQDLKGRWLPEKPSLTYTFAGEIPWCMTYPPAGTSEFRFAANRNTTFEVLIPVCDFVWEGSKTTINTAGKAVTLAKELSVDLGLINRAQEFDLFTKDGTRASLCISDHSNDFNNYQLLFFMREELLQSYLRKNDSTLIWVIWGYREYSLKWLNALSQSSNRPDQFHGHIRDIKRY